MSDLLALAELAEKASGPDLELDARIWCALNGKRYRDHHPVYGDANLTQVEFTEPPKRTRCVTGSHGVRHALTYTASLDAAMTLIDPADEWEISTLYNIARATVGLNRDHETAWPGYGEHKGADPVLAFLAAALRSLASKEEK